jgi:hypothetical protein
MAKVITIMNNTNTTTNPTDFADTTTTRPGVTRTLINTTVSVLRAGETVVNGAVSLVTPTVDTAKDSVNMVRSTAKTGLSMLNRELDSMNRAHAIETIEVDTALNTRLLKVVANKNASAKVIATEYGEELTSLQEQSAALLASYGI